MSTVLALYANIVIAPGDDIIDKLESSVIGIFHFLLMFVFYLMQFAGKFLFPKEIHKNGV